MIATPGGAATIAAVLRYMMLTKARDAEALAATHALSRRELGTEAESTMKTIADQLKEDGQVELLLRMLRTRFGLLPAEVNVRVREGQREDLERWADRILSARTLDEVFTAAPS